MQLAEKSDGQDMCTRGPQKNGGTNFALPEFLLFLHQRNGVAMDCVGDLVTQRSGELVRIFYEIQERIDDIHVAARSCERLRLTFLNEVELKRVVVSRLSRFVNTVSTRP